MRQHRLGTLCVLAASLLPAAAFACMWDYDTLQMERNRFPSALELITGKFLRHSREFYEWRITDRLEKLKNEPDNLAYYDDLAVAYSKTGRNDKAIETILIKDKRKPGLYESEANHSTFLMLAGRMEEGLKHIDEALRINPDAHFGREKYQKRLAEYVLSRNKDGKISLPLARVDDPKYDSFRYFLIPPGPRNSELRRDEADRKAAINAVLGMMRFANHDSPILLEALGDLLRNDRLRHGGGTTWDEKHLAARAYLKASYAVSDEQARRSYRNKADDARSLQLKYSDTGDELSLDELEASFMQEVAQADEWFAGVRKNEIQWIQEGKDADQEFTRYYLTEPVVDADPSEKLPAGPFFERRTVRIIGALCIVAILLGALLRLLLRRL
jgi:tetratricopeptide (TPR) repeat protein